MIFDARLYVRNIRPRQLETSRAFWADRSTHELALREYELNNSIYGQHFFDRTVSVSVSLLPKVLPFREFEYGSVRKTSQDFDTR